jgi:cysteinyl-tRNA synthetase, unknown class
MQNLIKLSVFIIGIILISILLISCQSLSDGTDPFPLPNLDFRQEMRDFVISLSDYSKNIDSNFIIIPQNGQELVSFSYEPGGPIATNYISAIDGTGREDLYYGYTADNVATPINENEYMLSYLDKFETEGIEVLTIDYCSTENYMLNSYTSNNSKGYISFAADQRNLNNIPDYPADLYNISSDDIDDLSQAKNFLYLINSENFILPQGFIDTVKLTNYDVIIMDLFHNEESYTSSQINELKSKDNGGNRLVICYMSIGEAEDYRFYWKNSWNTENPIWLDRENPDWAGNYKVRYWEQSWQDIIFGNDNSYLKKILDAGFDGVYLDIIDGFDYFENYHSFLR